MNLPKCPSCQGSEVGVLCGQRVVCRSCSQTKCRVFQFCCACQREWPQNASAANICKQPNCAIHAVLLSNDKITDSRSLVKGCPFFRACPGCKALLRHNGTGCPNITCPHCNKRFCFRCLRQQCFGEIDLLTLGLINRRLLFLTNIDLDSCKVVDNKQSLIDLGL
ncbi:hypothetical protein DNTS_032199 [Danionella cerebrum]|uniref:IBR domain-containing protein n=1 Tax=Danionella cerebrum TaxID=2873325 RepID=A0A553R3E8_9TELE|nr:hypothetical protein DNTS_032199 [Danionella translucida]